jgi:hypothetical protein
MAPAQAHAQENVTAAATANDIRLTKLRIVELLMCVLLREGKSFYGR